MSGLRILRRSGAGGILATVVAPLVAVAAIMPTPTELAPVAAEPSVQIDVAAAAGWTAWSDLKGGQYVLELRSPDGTISSPAAVAPATVPFRVALGRRSSGKIVAAYDACPGARVPATGAVASIGPGCRIKLLDVAAGTVTQLPLAPHTSSDALPALSRDTLAFVALPKATGTTARVMTVTLDGGAATTRWSAKVGHGSGPLQLAIDGKAVAALWSQASGHEQRLDAQTVPGAKVRKLDVAGDDESCCESDRLAALGFASAKAVSVLVVSADDEGDADWHVYRFGLARGVKTTDGPQDSASGDEAAALQAVSLAEDGSREVVLAADATNPYGIYAFAP
jgi:hypothetical protein